MAAWNADVLPGAPAPSPSITSLEAQGLWAWGPQLPGMQSNSKRHYKILASAGLPGKVPALSLLSPHDRLIMRTFRLEEQAHYLTRPSGFSETGAVGRSF